MFLVSGAGVVSCVFCCHLFASSALIGQQFWSVKFYAGKNIVYITGKCQAKHNRSIIVLLLLLLQLLLLSYR